MLIKPYCVIDRSEVGPGCQLGPFAHLREGTLLETGVHLGNFVETKKAHFGEGAKALPGAVYGVLLILAMAVMPGGVAGALRAVMRRTVRS